MRTGVFETNKSITYPDDVSFCFNPMLVRVQTNNAVTCTISDGGLSFTDKRTPYDGSVEMDVSMYAQVFFSPGGMDLILSKEITVQVQTSEDTFSFTTTVIWGAMNIGEVFNQSRTVTWFKNFPFTLSMYIASGATMRKRYDRNKYQALSAGSGLVHLNPSSLFGSATNFGVIRLDEEIPESTFDYTFDNTFRPVGDGVIINRLVVDDSECGVYLRWIDRHGFYQYWLFQEGESGSEAEAGDKMYYSFSDEKYGYNGVFRYNGKSMQMTKKACATLVDQKTFKMLLTILSSPLVDMYMDGNWVPVNISTKSVTGTMQALQDFEIEIEFPETISQSL